MAKNDLRGEEERSRLIYKGLSHHEYHYYFDKLYNKLNQRDPHLMRGCVKEEY